MDCFAALAMTGWNLPEIGWLCRGLTCETAAHESHRKKSSHPLPTDIAARVDAIDWTQATTDLDAQGCAVLKGLLSPDECAALAALYPDDTEFPQPDRDGPPRLWPRRIQIFCLSAARPDRDNCGQRFMRGFVRVANRWNETMGIDIRYPDQPRGVPEALP